MEDWLISETSSDVKMSQNVRETISTFASYVDDFFVELRKVKPDTGLVETYEVCLQEIKALELGNDETTMQSIWERAALRLTGLTKGRIRSSKTKNETATSIILKEFDKLHALLIKTKRPKVAIIFKLITKLNFIQDYLVLNVEETETLIQSCTLSMVAANGSSFTKLLNLRGKLYLKYLETFQFPHVSNIFELINTTVRDERKKYMLKMRVETVIKTIIESPASSKSLPDRIALYEKILECLKTFAQSETEFETLMTQIDKSSRNIGLNLPLEFQNNSELQEIVEKLKAENYMEGLPLLADLFEKCISIANYKEACVLITILKQCSLNIQQLKNLDYSQLHMLTTVVANFTMKNETLIMTNFLLQDEVEILQSILAKKWTLHIFKTLKTIEESRSTMESKTAKLIKENSDFIKDYISSSDEIVGATEFISTVELHLSKAIVNLKENDEEDKIPEFLETYLQLLKQDGVQIEPKDFMIKASTHLNKVSRDFVKIRIESQPKFSTELQNYKNDPWNLSSFSNLLKACCTSSTQDNYDILKTLADAFVYTEEINYKNFHSFNDNKEHEENCTIYASIFDTLANFEDEKITESSPESLKRIVHLFKNLVQSSAERNYSTVTDYIENRQYTFDMQVRHGLALNQNKILSEFQNLMSIYLNSSNKILSFVGMAEHFVNKLENQILPKLNKLKTFIREEEQKEIDVVLDSLNFECLLKYFNLLAIPNMPSEVRASVFHLKDPNYKKQLTRVIQILRESGESSSAWMSPFLLILNKLVRHIPPSNLSCTEIHDVVGKLPSNWSTFAQNLVQTSRQLVTLKFKQELQLQFTNDEFKFEELFKMFEDILAKADQVLHASCADDKSTIDALCNFYSTLENNEDTKTGNLQIQMLNKSLENLAEKSLTERFGNATDLGNLNINDAIIKNYEYFQHISNTDNIQGKWPAIFGMVVISTKLNPIESQFFQRLLRKSAPVWEPGSVEEKTEMMELIKKRSEAKENEISDDSNEFLRIMLSTADYLVEDDFCLQILTANERNYIRHTFSFTEQLEQTSVFDLLKELFIHSSPAQWLFELETFAVSKVYKKYAQMYFQDCMEILRKAEKHLSVETYNSIEEEVEQFLNSHVENAQNSEKLAILAESLTLVKESTAILSPLKYFIEQFLLFKYNFNRSHFLAGGQNENAKNDTFWFKWMQILEQRCILRKLAIQDFNKLFHLSANLPVTKLIQLASSHSLDNWMDALYLQIVVENYTSFLLIMEKGDLFNVPKEIEELKQLLSNMQKTSSRFLIILGEKLLQETQLAQVSRTNVKSSHVKIALTQLIMVPLDDKILNKLENQGILQWGFYIREQLLLTKNPGNVVALLLKLDKLVGIEMCDKFVDIFSQKFGKVENNALLNFLEKITSSKWLLDQNIIQKLTTETKPTTQIFDWETWFENHTSEIKKRFRDASEIIRLMKEDSVNSVLQNLLNPKQGGTMSHLELDVQQVKSLLKATSSLDDSTNQKKISDWTSLEIINWAQKNNSMPEGQRKSRIESNRNEILAIICQGLYVFTTKYDANNVATSPGFYPRDTQLLSTLLLISAFERRKGCLAEISTGEGKTYITAMMTIYRALAGDDVDVITSSSVLAEENVKEVAGYYALFGISATNNCDKIAEKDEEKRKARYQYQVIYGDVGSFQRDILLTTFFDKGITMNRSTETVIVDEVDSMLLDKGENILYLSHSIPDLKYLWPLLIEIWQGVHAPDVLRGRVQDVNMIISFVRERMRSGDIFFPQRLSSFIQRRLPVWVKNAFIAKSMQENDPYVLADLDKKGAKVIIVDKDTGVEQTQMHWSNGLHQFLQLKHGDKLSPESLKAVFMSNVGYFQSFKGRLYGITGTLGSTAERELLGHCYSVDFFSMPRFKARNCVEHEGILCTDEKEWIANVKREVLNKTGQDEQRAVLIICENISSVEKLVETLKGCIPPSKISTYKSSFDAEFHKKNKASPLQSGDVIVATNLAGRGTDLKTSSKLETFGGLHVILSFMTPNVRIETQGFGRTARAGLSGSVQFIVQNPEGHDSIEQLRQARDLTEAERLEKFRTRNMQRIEIEEELCSRFNILYEKIKENMASSGCGEDYTNLQLEFLKNQWALWLESSSEKIKILHMVGKDSIYQEFETFSRNMLSNSHGGRIKYATGAIELTKLGRHYENKEEYGNAISCFDQAIHLEPNYAEISHYYKAACILKQTDSGVSAKRRAIGHLKRSEGIIRKRIGQMITASKTLETTDSLRRDMGQGTSTNRYEKQVKHESELYQVHIGQIEEAIGHVMDGEFLAGSSGIKGVINKEEGEEILKALKKRYNILKNYRMSKKTYFNGDKVYVRNKKGDNTEVDWPSTFSYCKNQVIEYLKTKQLSSSGDGRIIEPEDFSNIVQSQESFWTLLKSTGFLQDEKQETVLVVKATKDEIDAVVMPTDRLNDVKSSLGKIILSKNGSVFTPELLTPLNLEPDEINLVTNTLKTAGILKNKINFRAEISSQIKSSLKWNQVKKQWDGIPTSLERYKDIIEAFIEEPKTEEEDASVSETSPKLRSAIISMSDLPLVESREEASRQLWSVLNEFGVIKDCRANFPINCGSDEGRIEGKLDEIRAALESCDELKAVFKKYHGAGEAPEIDDVMEVIKTSIGRIKTLPAIEIGYKELELYFQTGEYPPEIEEFREMLFADLLECTEKKSWWDWGAFIVAMLGIVQIIAGVLLEVFTAGAATYLASALISEGMGDIAFAIEAGLNKNFSWKNYRDHKLISLAITIVTAGVGAWLSRGAQVAKFAGKSGFQLFKAVAMRVIKKSVEAIVFKLADIGIDKLLECIQAEALKNCSSQLNSLFMSDPGVKSKLKDLSGKMDLLFQHSYEPGQAQKLIQDGLSRVLKEMEKEGVGLKITGYATKVTQGVAGAMGKASGKLVKHGNKVADNLKFGAGSSGFGKAAKLAQVGQVIEKLIKGGEIFQQLVQLVNLAPDILSRLIRYVEIQTINLKNTGKDKSKSKSGAETEAFSKFKEDFLSSTQNQIVELFLSKINSGLVSPAFQDLTHSALKKAGKAVEANTKALLRYVRTPKAEEVAILRKLRRKDALNEKQIGEKLKGKIDLDELDGNTPIKNSDGKTLAELRRVYGDSISVYKDGSGKFLVERPSFDQCMKTLGQGSKKPAGFFELMICANYYKQTIEINDMSGDLPEGGDDGKVRINPHGKENNNAALKVAFVKGKDGVGYFAPMIDGEVVYLEKEGKDNNLYQSLGFLKKFENNKGMQVGSEEWDRLIKEFNDSSTSKNSATAISKYAWTSRSAKFMYESGTFEAGTKMWDQSGITSGRRFGVKRPSSSSFGSSGGDNDDSIPDEDPGWRGNSMEIMKIGDDFTICDSFKRSNSASIHLPSNLDAAIDTVIETEGVGIASSSTVPKESNRGMSFRLDSRILERAVSLYLEQEKRVNLSFGEDRGYPSALVKTRSIRDGGWQSENSYDFMEFKVYDSDLLDVKEFKYI